MEKYDVFISFKNTDSAGNITYDSQMAAELYEELSKCGCRVFYSEKSLSSKGVSEYKFEIDRALDNARILVVVGTSKENLSSSWVRYEWDSFYSDILNGNTTKRLFSYIDKMGTLELPRTLRQLQCFEKKRDTLQEICDFICSAAGISKTVGSHKVDNKDIKPVTYSYHEDREAERLSSQARLVYENDVELLTPVVTELSKNRKINILDVGCADGYLTKLIFEKFSDKIQCLIGIDRDKECITIANNRGVENFHFYQIEFETISFEQKIRELMQQEKIESFDLVFSALVLHHLKNPTKFLRKVRGFLARGGIGYFRSCDDGEILSYPDENNLLRKTLDDSYLLDGMSDRTHGRKMYAEVYNAGFREIRVKSYYVTTADMDIDERIDFFFDIFYWRKNRYKRLIDLHPEDASTMEDYIKFCNAYDELEERFYDHAHYFMCAGPIAICKK